MNELVQIANSGGVLGLSLAMLVWFIKDRERARIFYQELFKKLQEENRVDRDDNTKDRELDRALREKYVESIDKISANLNENMASVSGELQKVAGVLEGLQSILYIYIGKNNKEREKKKK